MLTRGGSLRAFGPPPSVRRGRNGRARGGMPAWFSRYAREPLSRAFSGRGRVEKPKPTTTTKFTERRSRACRGCIAEMKGGPVQCRRFQGERTSARRGLRGGGVGGGGELERKSNAARIETDKTRKRSRRRGDEMISRQEKGGHCKGSRRHRLAKKVKAISQRKKEEIAYDRLAGERRRAGSKPFST